MAARRLSAWLLAAILGFSLSLNLAFAADEPATEAAAEPAAAAAPADEKPVADTSETESPTTADAKAEGETASDPAPDATADSEQVSEADAPATKKAKSPADSLLTPNPLDSPPKKPLDESAAKDAAGGDAKKADTKGEATAPAAGKAPAPKRMPWYVLALVVAGVLILPFLIGNYLGDRLRMPDHSWRFGLALCTLFAGAAICWFGWPPRLGPDLSGGVNLIYEVKPGEAAGDIDKLMAALARRINPGGIKEVTIRPYGQRQIEIIIPKADQAEIDNVKKSIVTAGRLEFRITANRVDHNKNKGDIIPLALDLPLDENEVKMDGQLMARWIKLDKKEFGEHPESFLVTRQGLHDEKQVLVIADPYDVTGEYLDYTRAGIDESGRPSVNFTFNAKGAKQFADLTTEFAPTASGHKRNLGIVLDDELLSAPTLNDKIAGGHGQITGQNLNVEFLVNILNAGSLPAALEKTPISEQSTSALLGADTIRTGAIAIAVSLVLVIIYMIFYYRVAGFIAVLALLANMVLLVAVMISIKAAFTLPGIAGLVLTIAMTVDCNVLIFERIREEQNRGASQRMAIRNGFDRAMTTIIDSNLTTLVSAVVLYSVGTDQLKGFAITLILGIIMGMYTAVFCAHIVFDVIERKKWVSYFHMLQFLPNANYKFVNKLKPAFLISMVLIAISLGGVALRGRNILDIDFLGGTSVTLAFKQPQDISEIRNAVKDLPDVTVYGVGEDNKLFRMDTSIDKIADVESKLRTLFGDKLLAHTMEFDPPRPVSAASTKPAAKPEDKEAEKPAEKVGQAAPRAVQIQASEPLPGDDVIALADDSLLALLQAKDDATDAGDKPAAETEPAAESESKPEPPADDKPAVETPSKETPSTEMPEAEASPAAVTASASSQTQIRFGEPLKYDSVQQMFANAFEELKLRKAPVALTHRDYVPGSTLPFKVWDVTMPVPVDQAERLLEHVKQQIDGTIVFPQSSNIGGKVAGDTQLQAFLAMSGSMLITLVYIWFRFHKVMFGIAAILALAHDVLITLGFVAFSAYFVQLVPGLANVLQIEPFKISLTVVAAFLTLVGYSLNDTIVIFDRIREVKGKSPRITGPMIDRSINECLGRTFNTFLTTFIVMFVLYAFGGSAIHAFAFCLLVGLFSGTYSSIFIAAPVLLWMEQGSEQTPPRGSAPAEPVKASR